METVGGATSGGKSDEKTNAPTKSLRPDRPLPELSRR
jgi:hypothetical protein